MSNTQPQPPPPQTESPPPSPQAEPAPDKSPPQSQAAPTSELPRGLVAHRSFNHTIIAIGKRGSGKSEWALGQCLNFAKIPAYIVAHDVGWKIPDRLWDGRPTYVRRSRSAKEAMEQFQKDPRGIFAISSPSCAEVAELAKSIAAASLEKHGGTEGHPVILYIDEIVSAEICDPHHLDPDFKRLLAEARHEHVGIIAGCQSARILNNQLLTMATHVQLFQITDKRDHRRLIECGIDEELVAQAGKLPPHKSITAHL